MIKRYEDFEITITERNGQFYADLAAAPGGRRLTQTMPATLPDDCVDWKEMCQGRKKGADLAELGHRLFASLITGEMAEKWYTCLGEVGDETGLRLRFSYQAGTLLGVPLEVLCRQTQPLCEFLALDPATPVVRSPRHGGSVKKREITLPLRMLVIIANPEREVQIDPLMQRTILEEALAGPMSEEKLIIDYLGLPDGPSADHATLRHTLFQTEYPYTIVHFSGHGAPPDADETDPEGKLLLVNKKSKEPREAYASDVASIFADSSVRLVVLQACEGARDGTRRAFQGVAQHLVARGIPAVLAMQCPVDKDVAVYFCKEFYDFWLNHGGLPIECAVTLARQALHQEFRNRPSVWAIPALFVQQESTDVLRINPARRLFSIQLKRGGILLERGQIDEAVAELKLAYEGAPDQAHRLLARALVIQAQLLDNAGDEDGALESCEQAIQAHPESATAHELRRAIWIRRGDEAAQRGDLDTASDAYQKAGETDKVDEIEAKKQRQEALEQSKGQQGAEPSEALPENWPAGLVLGEAYTVVTHLLNTRCSEIYRARELEGKKRLVAVKRLRPDKREDKETRKRFEREVGILGRMASSDLVLPLLFYSGDRDEERYFVTELAIPGSLRDYLETNPRKRVSPGEAFEIAKAMCQALIFLHNERIIHRDVKPSNIFLFPKSGEGSRVKLGDFSIASVPKEWVDGTTVTVIGTFMGTYAYAAPEQIGGILDVPDSDLFAWGVVFLEMLTGNTLLDILVSERKKFNIYEYLHAIKDEFPTSFFVERGVPEEFAPVLQKTLRKDPGRRPSACDLQEELDSIEYHLLEDIERHLSAGKEYMNASNWQTASAEFERGLELCQWCEESSELTRQSEELVNRIRPRLSYTQGMFYLSERRWGAAIEALEELLELDPVCCGVDIAEKLEQTRAEQQLEREYNRLLLLAKQESWTEVLALAAELDGDYKGPDGKTIDDIWKQALYIQGKKSGTGDPERAYHLLHILYEKDPDYEDVTALCAEVALENATRQDISISLGQKVEWLEKVVKITPDYREGLAQQLLDSTRHSLAQQLLEEKPFAVADQLERISANYTRWPEVFQALTGVYYRLLQTGNYARTERVNPDAEAEARYRLAMKWWSKGDFPEAAEQLERIDEEAQEFRSAQRALAHVYVAMGDQAYRNSNWKNAVEWLERAQATFKGIGEDEGLGFRSVRWALAQAYTARGDENEKEEKLEEAIECWKKAEAISKEIHR